MVVLSKLEFDQKNSLNSLVDWRMYICISKDCLFKKKSLLSSIRSWLSVCLSSKNVVNSFKLIYRWVEIWNISLNWMAMLFCRVQISPRVVSGWFQSAQTIISLMFDFLQHFDAFKCLIRVSQSSNCTFHFLEEIMYIYGQKEQFLFQFLVHL